MLKLLSLIKSDLLQAKIINPNQTINGFKLIFKFLVSRTSRVIILIRLSNIDIKIIRIMANSLLKLRFIEIGVVNIGIGFFLPHPQCIIIASGVKIGNNVHVGQYVTIGGNSKKIKKMHDGKIQKLPIIGDRVMINHGAVIGGPVTIGSDVIVGANAVVTHDVPSNSMVFGQNQLSKKKIKIPPTGGEYEILDE